MFKEFRDFVNRGNVLDLAVAVIIGAAYAKIVSSLTDDIIMPVIGKIFGGLDFSSYFIVLGDVPPALAGSTDYAALKKAGVPLLGYGEFVTQAVNFLIIAFVLFLVVKGINTLQRTKKEEEKKEPAPKPEDVVLLSEIRDLLKQKAS